MTYQRRAGSVPVSFSLDARDAHAVIPGITRRPAVVSALDVSPAGPQSSPRPGWVTSMVVGACCVVAGLVAWLATGHRWWEVLGLAVTAVLLGARVHYRVLRALLPGRSGLPEMVSGRARELVLVIGVFGPGLAGMVAWAGTHDWRWAVTGLTVGAVMPAVALLPLPGIATAILPSAEFAFGAMLLLVGIPGVLLGWLWTAAASVVFYGGIITVGGALLSMLTATLVVVRDSG